MSCDDIRLLSMTQVIVCMCHVRSPRASPRKRQQEKCPSADSESVGRGTRRVLRPYRRHQDGARARLATDRDLCTPQRRTRHRLRRLPAGVASWNPAAVGVFALRFSCSVCDPPTAKPARGKGAAARCHGSAPYVRRTLAARPAQAVGELLFPSLDLCRPFSGVRVRTVRAVAANGPWASIDRPAAPCSYSRRAYSRRFFLCCRYYPAGIVTECRPRELLLTLLGAGRTRGINWTVRLMDLLNAPHHERRKPPAEPKFFLTTPLVLRFRSAVRFAGRGPERE
jgi:hypothetical protein